MADTFDKAARSAIMARVPGKNTAPELRLRRALFALGLRYRLHYKALPGKPDIVFPKYRAVIFVHGCLWHWHGCRRSRMPATNADYWQTKIARNQVRDRKNIAALATLGWRVLIVWECALAARLVDASAAATAAWLRDDGAPPLSCIQPATEAGTTTLSPPLHGISLARGD